MELGINDLDFDEDDYGITYNGDNNSQKNHLDDDGDEIKPWMTGEDPSSYQSRDNEDPDPSSDENLEEQDIISLLLREKNITDPEKIKFEDEDGNIQERDWKTLTKEEQLNILRTPTEDSSNDLEDDEISLINQLRANQMTPEEFINAVKQQGVSEYIRTLESEETTRIDDLSDEELFILDMQSRVEDITDDEVNQALERAKQDPGLFERQMKGIREEYKRIEEEHDQMDALEQQQKDLEKFEEFKESILDSIQSLDKIGSLDISMEDDDMNEIANFILSSDSAGVNYFAKALNDPQTLVRMAWFALKGEEAIDSITDYFTQEIKKVSQSRYEQGLKDGKAKKTNSKETSTVYIKPQEQDPKPSYSKQQKQISIDDLD